ncbi:MAG: hypothetical protein KatS3mg015_2459 [Fimbriimonadales bacterium]|nr:MAG: hypothetical protein KatS3mg015_2459 [Fimbriimonadales bacterium]
MLVCALITWFAAAAAMVYATERAKAERDFLLRFVCTTIEVRKNSELPRDREVARRFEAILTREGKTCERR